jgi:VanZ family protein
LRTLLAEIPLSRRASIGLLLLVLMLCFFPFSSEPYGYIWGPLFDALHFSFFFLLSLPAFILVKRIYQDTGKACVIAVSWLLLATAVIEMIQPLTGRSANLVDIVNGALGICSGMLLMLWVHSSLKVAAVALILAGFLQVYLLVPASLGVKAALWQVENFPSLATFETYSERPLWRPISSSISLVNGKGDVPGLWVRTRASKYSGAQFNAGEKDWSSYKTLLLQVENPGELELTFNIRIDDDRNCESYDARFNQSYKLAPGVNELSIPLEAVAEGPKSRRLDLKRISKVYLFVPPLEQVFKFKVLRLELLS